VPNYESKIIEILRKSDKGLSTLDLSRKSGLSKTAIIKYLATFRMAGKADFEEVGSSRLWRLLTPTKKGKKEEKKKEEIPKNQDLDEILKEFIESAELTGFAIVDNEGSPLSAVLPKSIAPEQLGAFASLLFEVGIKSIELADLEEFRRIVVEGSKGRVLAYKEGKVLLIAFSKSDTMLGALKMETESLAKRINEILATREESEK